MTDKKIQESKGRNLFERVEAAQGFGFISDAIADWDDIDVFEVAANALENVRIVLNEIVDFLDENDCPYDPDPKDTIIAEAARIITMLCATFGINYDEDSPVGVWLKAEKASREANDGA